MKKVLIIGAGLEQINAIKKAKELGLFVVVTDLSPKAPGIQFADSYEQISTNDKIGNLNCAKKYKVNGVLTVCSETAVPTVAFVCEALRLPSFSINTAEYATNKAQMRQRFKTHGVPVSSFIISSNYEDTLDFVNANEGPWVIKPVDSSGQRGTFIVHSKDDIKSKFDVALEKSVSGQVLIDQEVKGREIHVTMFVFKNKPHFLAFSDRITLTDENFGIAVNHIGPSSIDSDTKSKLIKVCGSAIESIQLRDGVCTCEIIINDSNLYVMEIAVRVPGGYLKEIAELLSGIDIVEATILNAISELTSLEDLKKHETHKGVSAKFLTSLNFNDTDKELVSLDFDENYHTSESLILLKLHHRLPFKFEKLNNSVGRFGVLICTGDSLDQAVVNTERAFDSLRYNKSHKLINYKKYSFKHYK